MSEVRFAQKEVVGNEKGGVPDTQTGPKPEAHAQRTKHTEGEHREVHGAGQVRDPAGPRCEKAVCVVQAPLHVRQERPQVNQHDRANQDAQHRQVTQAMLDIEQAIEAPPQLANREL